MIRTSFAALAFALILTPAATTAQQVGEVGVDWGGNDIIIEAIPDLSEDGEDVFRESRSIILKSLRIKRIFDEANQTLIYLAHAQELTEGSAKMSISTVPLYGATLTADE